MRGGKRGGGNEGWVEGVRREGSKETAIGGNMS